MSLFFLSSPIQHPQFLVYCEPQPRNEVSRINDVQNGIEWDPFCALRILKVCDVTLI